MGGALCEPRGARHPVAVMTDRIADIFVDLGYRIAEGPEVEAEWFNFDALNMDDGHLSRALDHAFFVADPTGSGRRSGLVLRAHTSPVQVREMLGSSPPIRMVCTGRVFRPDPADATHSPVFSQVEGLAVDQDLTMADLRSTLDYFASSVFGEGTVTRLRPHRFAYTDPSAEVDVACAVCRGGRGRGVGEPCRTCGGEGWIEWGGCGMVHPRVLATCGIDPDKYSAFAFGMGIERTLMLRHGVADMRDIVGGDVRFALGTAEPPISSRAWPGLGLTRSQSIRRLAGQALARAGYVETSTFPFVGGDVWDAFGLAADDPRRATLTLVNPISPGEAGLRTTLLPGLLTALRRAVERGERRAGLFEQGTAFTSPPVAGAPPRLPADRRPTDEQLCALQAAIPAQPHHLAAVLTGASRWDEVVDAARAAAGVAGARLTARRGGRPPWLPEGCVELLAGRTVLGHAGELCPGTVKALGLPEGTGAMEIDLTALEHLTAPEEP
ncbi:hypothetical protein [Streptosporangium sp. NPDC051022]|uniref:tRNA ligase subunit PheS family protein n=1 Tax=Streptosporangium sp. NPDC051022 TaxID=3155752 RepID=UPI003415DDBC